MPAIANFDLSWFPLVARPRPPAAALEARIAELASLAGRTEHGTHQERATRMSAVLNNAALVASDCGVPALAHDLCRRQYRAFARAVPLPGWAAVLATQPVLNVVRQLIRDGHGTSAYGMLEAIHHAALKRSQTAIHGMTIDFSTLANTPDAHKEVCTVTWSALLADGTRALAQAGRWKEASEHAAANRGIGNRLLDGRQTAVLALLDTGQLDEAHQMVEQAVCVDPWEYAVQAILRVLGERVAAREAEPQSTAMLTFARELATSQDPSTAVTRARIGLTALDLVGYADSTHARGIQAALILIGTDNAYVARDLLAHRQPCISFSDAQRSRLLSVVRACGLGAGTIPAGLRESLMSIADRAEGTLATLLVSS